MSDTMFDLEDIKLPAELTKSDGYYNPEVSAARYQANREKIKNKYHIEKVLGKRRKNGMVNLKKLKPKHLKMIACYVSGMSINDIAEQFDVSQVCVQQTITDPLAAQYIDDFSERHKNEFNSMFPLVNNTIRGALESDLLTNQLKGVDRWGRLHKIVNGNDSGESAATKTQEIHAARFRFIDKVREIAEKNGCLEAEVVVVETTEVADS